MRAHRNTDPGEPESNHVVIGDRAGVAALPPRGEHFYSVSGGRPLRGEIHVAGAKNAAPKLIGADLLAKATKVDGVYDKDPATHADARRYAKISYDRVLADGLGVMDAAAVALCRDNGMPVLVFDLGAEGGIGRVAAGEMPGTLMSG